MGILESKIIKIIIHKFLVRILKVRITNEKDWLLRINLEIKKKKSKIEQHQKFEHDQHVKNILEENLSKTQKLRITAKYHEDIAEKEFRLKETFDLFEDLNEIEDLS